MENLSRLICLFRLCVFFRLGFILIFRLVLRLNRAVDLFNYLVKRQRRLCRRNLRLGLNINKRLRCFAFRLYVLLFGISDKLIYIHSVVIIAAVCLRSDINGNIFSFLFCKGRSVV